MFVTIYEEVMQDIKAQHQHKPQEIGGVLTGRSLDQGDVVQVTSVAEAGCERVGIWGHCADPEHLSSTFIEGTSPGETVILLDKCNNFWVGERQSREIVPVEYDIIRLHADFACRLDGLFDTTYLANKTVTIIGLGTGGSLAAVELAKNGVGHFRLVDFDRLETHNIARHACGLGDIGRYKTYALADLLQNKHPCVEVKTYEIDVLQEPEQLKSSIEDSDLVIAATDSEASKRRINEVCWTLGIPAVYGAAYDRAFGGDVLRVMPPNTPCYECFYKQITDIFDTAPKKTIDYSSEDPTQVVAEPGLGLDVAFIGLILTKMALLTLLRDTQSSLEEFPKNYVMWGNRKWWLFEYPLQSIFLDVSVNPTCPVCHREAYVEEELHMSIEEAKAKGESLVEEVSDMQSMSLDELKG